LWYNNVYFQFQSFSSIHVNLGEAAYTVRGGMFIYKWQSAGSNPRDKSAYREANSFSASQEIATPCGTEFTTARHI